MSVLSGLRRVVTSRRANNSIQKQQHPLVLWSGQVVFQNSGCLPGTVVLDGHGRISHCIPNQTPEQAKQFAKTFPNASLKNLGEKTVLSPGLIDVHVHISELGRDWEGYETATRAAAAGGITTIMGMPLNSLPSTTTVQAVEMELAQAQTYSLMADVGLWGGVVPDTLENGELESILRHPAIFGIKAFLAPLPPSAGYQAVSPQQLAQAAELCGKYKKPLLVHSELMTQEQSQRMVDDAFEKAGNVSSYEAHLQSRPAKWEQDAVSVVCDLIDLCDVHIVHLSDSGCLPRIVKAKAQESKHRLTVETCPHYLLFAAEDIPSADTRYKCFPPIRSAENQQQLKRALHEGLIDMIASDHSPCDTALRKRDQADLKRAWGGLTGLQYQLPATITAVKACDPLLLAKWWSSAPSMLVPGLNSVKGSIAVGKQADLVAWNFESPSAREHHRWRGDCLYTNMPLSGRVVGTWLASRLVYNGETDSFPDEHAGAVLLN